MLNSRFVSILGCSLIRLETSLYTFILLFHELKGLGMAFIIKLLEIHGVHICLAGLHCGL